MEVRLNKNDQPIIGSKPILDTIKSKIDQFSQSTQQKLAKNPDDFRDIEIEVHNEFRKMADLFVAGILAETTAPDEFTENAQKK